MFYLTKDENKEVDKVQQVAKCSRIEQDWKQKDQVMNLSFKNFEIMFKLDK